MPYTAVATPKKRGPNTPEGKARSRMNALKHGLRAREFGLLPEEDQAEWGQHVRDLEEGYGPEDATEKKLVASIAAAMWREIRADRMEAEVLVEIAPRHAGRSHGSDLQVPDHAASLNTAIRYQGSASMAVRRATRAFFEHRKAKLAGLLPAAVDRDIEICTNELSPASPPQPTSLPDLPADTASHGRPPVRRPQPQPRRGAAARRRRSRTASPRPAAGIGIAAMARAPLASSSRSMANRLRAASAGSPPGLRLRMAMRPRQRRRAERQQRLVRRHVLGVEPQRQARRIVAGELPRRARCRRVAAGRERPEQPLQRSPAPARPAAAGAARPRSGRAPCSRRRPGTGRRPARCRRPAPDRPRRAPPWSG